MEPPTDSITVHRTPQSDQITIDFQVGVLVHTTVSGTSHLRRSRLRRCRLKDSDQIDHSWLVLNSGGQIAIAINLGISPLQAHELIVTQKRFRSFISHHSHHQTNPSIALCLHQIMYRLTGDPHIHPNHAAGISTHVAWSALHNVVHSMYAWQSWTPGTLIKKHGFRGYHTL